MVPVPFRVFRGLFRSTRSLAPGKFPGRHAPVEAEEAGGADAADPLREHLRADHRAVGEADAGEEVGEAVGEAHPDGAGAGDDADEGAVAARSWTQEKAGQVVA